MALHAAPTPLSRTRRRAAVAAGAIAATAALTAGTPGVSNAAVNPLGPSNILKQSPQTLLGILPTVPGALPLLAIPAARGQVAAGVKTWNGLPIIGTLLPATAETPDDFLPPMPGALDTSPPHAPSGWFGNTIYEKVGVTAPLGLGGVSNNFYGGLLFPVDSMGDMVNVALGDGSLAPLTKIDVGGVVGDQLNLNGPFGSSLNTDAWLTSTRTKGVTTFAPGLQVNATAPFGLGNALFTFSPGSLAFGNGTFLVTGPSLGVNLSALGFGGSFNLTTGSIGVQNNNLVLTTPTIGAGLTTPVGGGSVSTTAGTASVGASGVALSTPTVAATATTPVGSGGVSTTAGSASVGTSGVSLSTPGVSTSVTAAGNTAAASVGSASAHVGTDGASVAGPKVTGTLDNGSTTNSVTASTGGARVSPSGAKLDPPSVTTSSTPDKTASKTADTSSTGSSSTGSSSTGSSSTGSSSTGSSAA